MLSLRDKLKAVGAQKPRPEKPAPEDCMIRETVTPLSCFSLRAE